MICSVFVASSVVGEILLIMNRQKELTMDYDEQMQESREFMMSRAVPLPLQAKVYRYLETQHRQRSHNNIATRGFIDHLSKWLQVQLYETLNRGHICRHPFFEEIDNPEIVRRLC